MRELFDKEGEAVKEFWALRALDLRTKYFRGSQHEDVQPSVPLAMPKAQCPIAIHTLLNAEGVVRTSCETPGTHGAKPRNALPMRTGKNQRLPLNLSQQEHDYYFISGHPYMCSCGQSFTGSQALQGHLKRNVEHRSCSGADERKWVCPAQAHGVACNYAAREKSRMQSHLEKCHGVYYTRHSAASSTRN